MAWGVCVDERHLQLQEVEDRRRKKKNDDDDADASTLQHHRERPQRRRDVITSQVLLGLLLLHVMTAGVSALGPSGHNCQVDLCSRRFGNSVQQRGDELALCQGLLSYGTCLRENARSCRGNLKYHTTLRGLTQLALEYNCSARLADAGSTSTTTSSSSSSSSGFDDLQQSASTPSPLPPISINDLYPERPKPPPNLECTYRGPHTNEMRHCGLFGDPHLKTFSGDLQTCRVRGAWPLIDSPYLAVQVTNEPVRPGSHATVTTKVTVIVKGNHSPCTTEKVYEAQAEYLPDTFIDGSTTSNLMPFHGSGSVTLHVLEPGMRIEIRVRHLAARLLLRRVAGALSFSAQMPLELALPPGFEDRDQQGSLELCSRGCPFSERLRPEDSRTGAALHEAAALEVCRSRNLSATYLDWCVFDVMTTGDKHFAEAAYAAQADVIQLDPSADAVLASTNSRWLSSGGASTVSASPLSAWTLCVFFYILSGVWSSTLCLGGCAS